MMPDEDGWEVSRKIKSDERTKEILIAMFTVRTSEESVKRSMEYGHADAHIEKPFETRELLKVICDLLKK
jgi:DNA-binding response OmpR family regulator